MILIYVIREKSSLEIELVVIEKTGIFLYSYSSSVNVIQPVEFLSHPTFESAPTMSQCLCLPLYNQKTAVFISHW